MSHRCTCCILHDGNEEVIHRGRETNDTIEKRGLQNSVFSVSFFCEIGIFQESIFDDLLFREIIRDIV